MPHVKVLERSTWNKHAWKKLEKLVYTVNFEGFCNACYGQSNFNACFLLLFCLPSKLLKDDLCHHFIWVDLWQLSGLLTLLFPQCSSSPSSLLASSPSLNFLFKVKALLRHFGEPQLLKATSTNWSFGKEYYSYPADIISLSQWALLGGAYAPGLVCSALGCTGCDSQMQN